MNVFDLHHNSYAVPALVSQAISTDTTTVGEIIDTAGCEAIEFIFLTKTVTDGDYEVQIFESDDAGMSGEAQVAAEETFGAIDYTDDADDNTVARMGVASKKRYLRAKVVSTSTSTGVDIISGVALKVFWNHQPIADQNG